LILAQDEHSLAVRALTAVPAMVLILEGRAFLRDEAGELPFMVADERPPRVLADQPADDLRVLAGMEGVVAHPGIVARPEHRRGCRRRGAGVKPGFPGDCRANPPLVRSGS